MKKFSYLTALVCIMLFVSKANAGFVDETEYLLKKGASVNLQLASVGNNNPTPYPLIKRGFVMPATKFDKFRKKYPSVQYSKIGFDTELPTRRSVSPPLETDQIDSTVLTLEELQKVAEAFEHFRKLAKVTEQESFFLPIGKGEAGLTQIHLYNDEEVVLASGRTIREALITFGEQWAQTK